MKLKTSELTGPALDWAVAKCKGVSWASWRKDGYSTDWHQGGPIIEWECIQLNLNHLRPHVRPSGETWIATRIEGSSVSEERGPTQLVAAMRCYVASQLGDEVEVPDELV